MMVAAANFYQLIQDKLSEQKNITAAAYEVIIATGEWLKQSLSIF